MAVLEAKNLELKEKLKRMPKSSSKGKYEANSLQLELENKLTFEVNLVMFL